MLITDELGMRTGWNFIRVTGGCGALFVKQKTGTERGWCSTGQRERKCH